MKFKLWRHVTLAAALMGAVGSFAVAPAVQAAEDMFIPVMSYRSGPFASTGIPLMDGHKDYMNMINERDGGINGIKVNWVECETGYNTEKGMECYEKNKAEGALLTQPWSTGISLQVIPKTNVDKIPVYGGGYGLSAAAVGDLFPWVFIPPQTYWDGASAILRYIAGGNDLSKLKGQKIAFLHLDHPFGKEPLPLLERMSVEHGFQLVSIPVGLKEMMTQSAQWLQIRREKPDYVIMWGWGAMNDGAITEAVKTKYDMSKFIGVWWSGHDGSLEIVGDKGKGYKALTFNLVDNYPAIQDIKKHVVDKGKSDVKDDAALQKVFYQRGAIMAATIAEAVRTGQAKFGNKALSASELRWGFEHLDITADRWAELGFKGAAQPVKLSCSDHAGQSPVWVVEWDGSKFVKVSEPISSDKALVRQMLENTARSYAESNKPWPGRGDIACD